MNYEQDGSHGKGEKFNNNDIFGDFITCIKQKIYSINYYSVNAKLLVSMKMHSFINNKY